VQYILRKLAAFNGHDLRGQWESGSLTLADLETALMNAMTGTPGPALNKNDKGKAKALDLDDDQLTIYPGVC
jgi:hypothetical protein